MTQHCPHCWTPTAERLAAENAARVAHEATRALLAGLLREATDAERDELHARKEGVA